MRFLREKKLAALIMAAGSIAGPLVAHATTTTATWIGASGANWDAAGSWNPAEPGTGTDDEAIFNTSGASANLDTSATLGILNFEANASISVSNSSVLNFYDDDQSNPGILPAVYMSANTTATISALIDYIANSAGAPRFVFNQAGNSGTTLNINGGLTTPSGGAVSFDSGIYNQNSAFTLGDGGDVGNDGGTAVLNVNATFSDTSGPFLIGGVAQQAITVPGIGTVNQTSATTFTSVGTLRIGQSCISNASSYTYGVTAGYGTYNLSGGGTLATGSGTNIVVGSQDGTGVLNVSGASSKVNVGGSLVVGNFNIPSSTAVAPGPGYGGSGAVTLTDGTINVNLTGTGTAMTLSGPNPTAQSSVTIDGSTSTSGGRLVVTTGGLAIANGTIGGSTVAVADAAGGNGILTIEDGGTASIGSALTVGQNAPSYAFISTNTASVSISGTTPNTYTSKLYVGTVLNVGISGATGTFTADESDTVPISIGSSTTAGSIVVGTCSSITNAGGTSYSGGTGSINLSGQTVMNVNNNTTSASGATVIALGSNETTNVSGQNLGGTGSITLSNNAVLNVNNLDNANPLNVVIGKGGVSDGFSDAGSGTITLQNNAQFNIDQAGSLSLGTTECPGTLNVSNSAEVTVAGQMTLGSAGFVPSAAGSAGVANGPVGTVTLTDGTITVNNAGTGTAVYIGGGVDASGQSLFTINGSQSTTGGRLVVANGSVSIANQNIGAASTTGDDAAGANGALTIANGGTASVGSGLTVGGGVPSVGFVSPNTATVTISGTTPAAYTSKLSVGGALQIGISGGTGTFTADESDTVPINIGSATSAGSIFIANTGSYTNAEGTVYNGGNGSMALSGSTVTNVNNNSAVAATIISVGDSATTNLGTNIGSTGSITLSNNAVLNVNPLGNTTVLNVIIGNGIANDLGDAGSGTMTLTNSSAFNMTGGTLIVGDNETSGSLSVQNSAQVSLTGSTAALIVGDHSGSADGAPTASVSLSGTGSLISAPSITIGLGVPASASVSGGTLDATTGGITVGSSSGAGGTALTSGNGSLTVTGGTVETAAGGNLLLCAGTSNLTYQQGTLSLQGGLVQVSGALESNGTASTASVNFTGGELQAGTINPLNFTSSVSQSALPAALQQTSDALVQTNTSSASLLHAASQNLAITDGATGGGYVLLGGTAQVDSGYTLSVNGLTSVNSGTIQGAGTFSTSATNGFGINGTLTVAGPGIVNLNGPSLNQATSALVVTGGTVNVSVASLPPPTVAISGSGLVHLADNMTAGTPLATSNVNLTSLSITGDGTLDIGNNRIIVDYSSPATDPIASIAAWIKNGFYDLTGPQIISSDITADDAASGLSYGIGYADGADGAVAGLPSGEIEIMFTLLGDANLDGTVNSEDFSPFSHNLGQSGQMWDDGDFNYDGTVNSEDFASFSHNLGQTASLAASTAGILEGANGISLTNVPEPASIGLLALGVVGVLTQRRRYKRTAS
jgi:hypothetical protein